MKCGTVFYGSATLYKSKDDFPWGDRTETGPFSAAVAVQTEVGAGIFVKRVSASRSMDAAGTWKQHIKSPET